jgi:hypothetical protein
VRHHHLSPSLDLLGRNHELFCANGRLIWRNSERLCGLTAGADFAPLALGH